jgi:hypothetical protein
MLTLVSVVEFVAISIVVSILGTKVILVQQLMDVRHTFMIMMTSLLSRVGIWILPFTSALLEPPFVCCLLLVLLSQHTCSLPRKVTTSFRTRSMLRRCPFVIINAPVSIRICFRLYLLHRIGVCFETGVFTVCLMVHNQRC